MVWEPDGAPVTLVAASDRLAARRYLIRIHGLSQRQGLRQASCGGFYGFVTRGRTPLVYVSRKEDFEGLCDGAEMVPLSGEDKA